MTALLKKEIKLCANPLSFFFLAFSLMAFIPNYPTLLSGFFICFGVFHSFQSGREASDIIYTAMLPVAKADIVKAKYAFTCFIQLLGFALLLIFAAIRYLFMSNVQVYISNNLMNGNLALTGYYLFICTAFNVIFLGGFWKTAYKIGIPFLGFGIAAFILIFIFEALHFLPGLSGLNSCKFEAIQLIPPVLGIVIYTISTIIGLKKSVKSFSAIDL